MSEPTIVRPPSCPAPGVVPAFDAGWNAREVGMGRETVGVLTHASGREWALLGYDAAELAAAESSNV